MEPEDSEEQQMHHGFEPKIQQPRSRDEQQNQKAVVSSSNTSDDSLSQESSDEEDSFANMEIIGGSSASEQLLLIKGLPGQGFSLNGRIISSNKPFLNGLGDGLVELLERGFREIESKEICYYIVSKKPPYNGKILLLSSQIYPDRFYVDWDYLLLVNLLRDDYKRERHPTLKHLKSAYSDKFPDNALVLQGQSDRPIIEKTLAEDQQMYIPNGHVIAMSETVEVLANPKTKQRRLKGPGIVFFEPRSKINMSPKLKSFLLINCLMVMFLLALTAIEVYVLGLP